jgi:hypothetical protein
VQVVQVVQVAAWLLSCLITLAARMLERHGLLRLMIRQILTCQHAHPSRAELGNIAL